MGHSLLTPETKDFEFKIWFPSQLCILGKRKCTWKNGSMNKHCLLKMIFLFYYHSFDFFLYTSTDFLHSNPATLRPFFWLIIGCICLALTAFSEVFQMCSLITILWSWQRRHLHFIDKKLVYLKGLLFSCRHHQG